MLIFVFLAIFALLNHINLCMEYTELLEKQIIGRLKVDNPWWTEGRIPDYYAQMSPRLYLNIFYAISSIHRYSKGIDTHGSTKGR